MNTKINIKDIKTVFFDMDGTLLSSQKEVSKNTLQTLNKLKEKEINISIATGRPYYFLLNELAIVKPNLPVITCNGALIYDPKLNEVISCSSIDKNASKKIYEILIKNNAVFLIYAKDRLFMIKNKKTNPISNWFNWVLDNVEKNHFTAKEKVNQLDVEDELQIENYEVIKFLIIDSEMKKEDANKIEEEVNQLKEVYIVRSQENVFDIMPYGLSKGYGITKLSEQKLIDLNTTLVFGDADNDVSMFEVAKWSVAMGNANDNLKKIASFVTKTNDEEGIVHFFEEVLKI